MQGGTATPDTQDLDDLGDSDFGLGHQADEPPADESNNQNAAFDPSRFVAAADVAALVQKGIAEFLASSTKQNPPAPAPTARAAELVAPLILPEDVDRLWDWLRADPTSAQSFFGLMPKNSMQLHRIFATLGECEQSGVGLARAIYLEGPTGGREHIGFGMLAPIMGAEKLAVVHLYLSPARRGYLAQLAAALLELTAQHLPPGFKFAIIPSDVTQTRLYGQVLQPLGFTTHTIYVR